jgi:hydrogenase nickel incorporation protein HypA/HybF
MHELSIAAGILEAVLDKGRELKRIDEVHLSVGCLMMINTEQLGFGFEMLSKGTAAEKAKLLFTMTRAKLRCPAGHETFMDVEELDFNHLLPVLRCGACGAPTEILEGRDLFLTRIIGE